MARYEVLLLTIPEVTGDEAKGIESQLQGILRTAKGTLVSFERWGKYRLAFAVKKHEYGVYFLARFELPDESKAALGEIKALVDVKFCELIMRSIFTALEDGQSLVYQRPASLEETPRREAGSFLRSPRHEGSRSSDGVAFDDEVGVEDDYDRHDRADKSVVEN